MAGPVAFESADSSLGYLEKGKCLEASRRFCRVIPFLLFDRTYALGLART
jgi:hypothetical protein